MKTLLFLEPAWLWLLAVLPLFGLLLWLALRLRGQDLLRFSEAKLFRQLNPGLAVAWSSRYKAAGLFLLAVLLIFLAVARPGGNPQYIEEEIKRKGVDIMLAVDLSASMKAVDIVPSRMEATKMALRQFVGQLSAERVGMVVFAGSVSLQLPLTFDYRTAAMMMDIINTDFLPEDGTALGDAIDFGLEKLGKENQKGGAIVLLTDGENTRGQPPLEAARRAAQAGTRIYTIGLGTLQGAKIPEGIDAIGRPKFKVYQGEVVTTKLDEETLKQIAALSGGQYFGAPSAGVLQQAYQEIRRLTRAEHMEKKKKVKYQEYYPWFALPAMLLLMLEMYITRRRSWWAGLLTQRKTLRQAGSQS